MQLTEKHHKYWAENLKLSALLMVIWFVVTFVMAWYARELSEIYFAGWHLSFYMAAQGAPIIYVALIWHYSKRMGQLDDKYGVSED